MTLAVFLAIGCSGRSGVQGRNPNRDPQGTLLEVAQQLRAGTEFSYFDVLYVPPDVETPKALSPGDLRRAYNCKLSFYRNNRAIWQGLADSLSTSTARPAGHLGDMRWAIVFHRAGGGELGVYLDQTAGDYGSIDDTPVAFSGGLRDWLRAQTDQMSASACRTKWRE